jgi:hypothetical protein
MQADEEIANQFSFLETERGFRCNHRRYGPAHFGNAIVEYVSATRRLRIVKDRGQYLCDFARSKGVAEWFDQDVVLRALGDDATVDALIAQQRSSLHEVARTTRESLDRAGELFSDGNYSRSVARFRELQGQRAAEVLSRLSQEDNTNS